MIANNSVAKHLAARFLADEAGATAIEYCLIASIVSISIVAAAMAIGTNLVAKFTEVAPGLK